MIGEKFYFPLQYELEQPGLKASQVRKRRVTKKRITAFVQRTTKEEEEQKQRLQEQTNVQVDDIATSSRDFWTCNEHFLIRHHKTPRKKLFSPDDVDDCPIPSK